MDTLDICCISEHWLHSYDLYLLNNIHPDFHAWGIASPNEEDETYCAPRFHKGHGGVAIFWGKNLYQVQKLKQLANHHCVGITLDNNTSVFSVYLPSRSGCTYNFKESLDMLQVIKENLDPSGIVIFAGDLNADPGTHGGPLSTTPVNEQGCFLARYIQSWGFTSAHLHLSDTPSSHTFENPSKQCKSTIGHFICASRHLPHFTFCHVIHDHPTNTSDHCPIVAEVERDILLCRHMKKRTTYNWKKLS